MNDKTGPFLEIIATRLMIGRTQRYLRYLHMREALLPIIDEIETVCVAGAGYGLAEIAIAAEFPHLQFTLTDAIGKGYPSYHSAMDLCWEHGVNNVNFSVWNVIKPTWRRFDLVCSTEVLEHIPAYQTAAANFRLVATKWIYCLVPYANSRNNMNLTSRMQAMEKHEHQVVGFDERNLETLFGTPTSLAGAYWADAGLALRQQLMKMTDDEIRLNMGRLVALANQDLRTALPSSMKDASGIRVLARADAPLPTTPVLPPRLARLQQMVDAQDTA